MKDAKKSGEYEPKLADLMEAMQTGFARVDERFERVGEQFSRIDERFSSIDERFSGIDATLGRHEKLLVSLVDGQNLLNARVSDMDRRLIKTQHRVEDVADLLEDMTEIVDENRDLLFEHGERITILQKTAA